MNSLDKKSIDSFLRAAGGLAKSSLHSSSKKNGAALAESNPVDPLKDMSVIDRAVKEGENIRLILRSSGHVFPAKDNTTHHDDSNPAYVVCLAHHVPSDQFILFVFNSTTMPCQLIRFDRDGNVVESDVIRNHMCWSKIDAAVLVAAVNKCHEGNAAYFDNTACASNDKRRGGCVRLVNMKDDADGSDVKMRGIGEEDEESDEEDLDEDEFEVIRALILAELLNDGSSGANFHHPDPNFLLPLAESISKELYNWRYMCNHIPSRSKWPKLPSPSEWRASTNAEGISASEREELDDISSGRNSQFRKSVEYCQNAIEKMKSLLCKIAERGIDSASIYELGKEGIMSLTTLEFMNQQHGDAWPDYHDVFEEIVHTCFEASTQIKENLMTWKGASESIPMEESDDEESLEWEEDDGHAEVASKLVSAWIKEDKALLNALSNVVTTIDQTLKSEQQSLQGAIDRVESELDSILSLKKDAERKTKLYASRIIKLWDNFISDDDDGEEGSNEVEEEPSLRKASLPQWSKYDLESQLYFGWCETEHEDSSVMKFIIDVAGLTAGLKEYIGDLTSFHTNHSQTKFDYIWKKKIQPAVNSTVNSIKTLLELGDLRNASIVAVCSLSVFCDGDTIGAVGHWHEHNESYDREDGSKVVVAKKFQALWREYHPYVAAIALAYFEIESPKREAGSHWFFDILQSGYIYAPSNSWGK